MLRLAIVSDICFYRQGLAEALDRFPEFSVVGQACGWREALPMLRRRRPEVVLLDPEVGQERAAIGAVATAAGCAKIVALSVDEEADVLRLAQAGISGYVTRDASMADVVTIIEQATRGELTCSPRIAASLLERVAVLARDIVPERDGPLTGREWEIVGLIGAGFSNREIGEQLFIERTTVKNHVHNILRKLQVTCRADAAAWLLQAPQRPSVDASPRPVSRVS